MIRQEWLVMNNNKQALEDLKVLVDKEASVVSLALKDFKEVNREEQVVNHLVIYLKNLRSFLEVEAQVVAKEAALNNNNK
jgi:hypothetical protein